MNNEEKELFLEEFVKELVRINNKVWAVDFLTGILTPKELEQVIKRLQIIKKIKKGMSQRKIAEELDVGIATVTRGSREIRKGRFKYVK